MPNKCAWTHNKNCKNAQWMQGLEMPVRAPSLPRDCPTERLSFEGRNYPLIMENGGWRMRSRSKKSAVDFRTGASNLTEAKRRGREWLTKRADDPIVSRKGGGSLEALSAVYLATPKRTQTYVAKDNISRLRSICHVALGRDLAHVTCREVGPELWAAYQRAALAAHGLPYDLATRHRQNIAINSAVRAARCLFLDSLRPHYRAADLDVRPDAGHAPTLPQPYVPPTIVDDAALLKQWSALPRHALWLTVGIARFAGLRREEIACLRVGWIEERNGVAGISLRDRPEEKFWTKTGKPYFAQVIDAEVSAWLLEAKSTMEPDAFVVSSPGGTAWFENEPQRWIRAQGINSSKPLHRLRGLYADAVAQLTADAVAARLAGIRAAQQALGHTNPATTERHYLSK